MSLERVLLTLYGSPVSDMLLNTLKSIIYVDDMGFFPHFFPTYGWRQVGPIFEISISIIEEWFDLYIDRK